MLSRSYWTEFGINQVQQSKIGFNTISCVLIQDEKLELREILAKLYDFISFSKVKCGVQSCPDTIGL